MINIFVNPDALKDDFKTRFSIFPVIYSYSVLIDEEFTKKKLRIMSRINKETLTVSEYDIIHTNFETIFEIVFIIEIVKGCVSLRVV